MLVLTTHPPVTSFITTSATTRGEPLSTSAVIPANGDGSVVRSVVSPVVPLVSPQFGLIGPFLPTFVPGRRHR